MCNSLVSKYSLKTQKRNYYDKTHISDTCTRQEDWPQKKSPRLTSEEKLRSVCQNKWVLESHPSTHLELLEVKDICRRKSIAYPMKTNAHLLASTKHI